MKKIGIILLGTLLLATNIQAQNNSAEEIEYKKTLAKRAEKLMASMNLTDSVKYKRVRDVIVQQYQNLNAIHEEKNVQTKIAKDKADSDKLVKEAKLKSIEESAANRLKILHEEYLSKLSADLSQQQVESVKDGMTYNVLRVTYKAYQDMIPTLKEAEKKQILNWLTEARELAMDAGTSDGKHQIFGKYKGRINNYLSGLGYDLQAERKAWEERIKVAKVK